jgi:3',5'-cyclic AMP phosphodiesterase CpdA
LEPEDGPLAPGEGREPSSVRAKLLRAAAPWRTEEQLRRLEREPRRPDESFRFALIGDAEPGRFWFSRRLFNERGVFPRLLSAADAQPVDFIFQLGDMVSRGVKRNFLRFFELLSRMRPSRPYLTAIGNHDRQSPHGVSNGRLYQALFGPSDYFFDRGGWRVVVLDTSARRLTPGQLAWLDDALDTELKKIVITHVPPAPLSEWTDWGRLRGVGGFREGAAEFMGILERRGAARVYMGHIHALGALTVRGVRYILTGGGGSPLYPGPVKNRFHHYLTIDAGPDGLSETVHRADGGSAPLEEVLDGR